MKAAILLLTLSGFILGISAVCDIGGCDQFVSSDDCTKIRQYIDCMNKEADGCKATAGDLAKKVAIEAKIGVDKTNQLVQGCGACAVTVSITTLFLSFIAVFMRM